MRHYYIYLIEDEVAKNYYGREDKLFTLFQEARTTRNKVNKRQLNRQIQYVTKRIPMFYYNKKVYEALKVVNGYNLKDTRHALNFNNERSTAELQVHNHHITLDGSGFYKAETLFFETLRQIHPYFLAIDFEHIKYGWLKPIKNAHLI